MSFKKDKYEVVKKAVDKLSQPDAVFRDSLLGNILDMCSMLPNLNVTDDAQLESMRQSIERQVASLSPDRLRHDNVSRSSAALALDNLTKNMQGFL